MPSNNSEEINKLNEDYESSIFRLVMNDVTEKEGKLLHDENELIKNDPEYQPSKENIELFTKLLDLNLKKNKEIQTKHRLSKILYKTAVALFTIIMIFTVMMVTVQAFRNQVLNFIISIEPKYTSLQLKDDDDDQSNDQSIVYWKNAYVPTYIPEGYKVDGITYSDSIKKINFVKQDDDTTIIYTEYESINSIAVDTEDASLVESVKIHSQVGTLTVKDSRTTIAWTIDNHLFTVQGQMSTDEAVKIAEGVKFIN